MKVKKILSTDYSFSINAFVLYLDVFFRALYLSAVNFIYI
jgi:hypothetical protein